MDQKRALILLKAASDILHKADDSFYVLETMSITAEWDSVECDANCLMEEIDDLLEDAKTPKPLKPLSEITQEDAIKVAMTLIDSNAEHWHVNIIEPCDSNEYINLTIFTKDKDDFINVFISEYGIKTFYSYSKESVWVNYEPFNKARELGYNI